ncbi:MAG TPA: DMT family transporter [Phycisphaerae bacterium]|nr:DMT family transporter [Phycisphaerae bacterium]
MESPAAPVSTSRPDARMAWFVLLLVLVNIVWAGQLSAGKFIARDDMPEPYLGPFAIAFLPFFFITPLLLPFLIRNRRKNPDVPRPTWSDWRRFVVAGVGGQMVAQLGMTWGPLEADPSSCGILYLLIPVLTAVFASVLLRERITPLRIVCLAIGLIGAGVISSQGVQAGSFFESAFFAGNLLMLMGCVGASFYNVYCKSLMARFHERDILIYSYITATPASLPILLWKEPDCFSRLVQMHDWRAWVAFAFLTLFVYGISMLMLFHVLQFLPVTVVLASTYLTPVFAVVLGKLLWGDQLTPTKIVGGAVVLLATVLIMRYDHGGTAAPPQAAPGACPSGDASEPLTSSS